MECNARGIARGIGMNYQIIKPKQLSEMDRSYGFVSFYYFDFFLRDLKFEVDRRLKLDVVSSFRETSVARKF